MSELKLAIKLTYQQHRRFEQEAKAQQMAAQDGLGGGGPYRDAGGNPSQKFSTGSSPAPKATTRSGAGAMNQKSTTRTSAVLGLEADAMVRAPSESRKFRMVAEEAAQAVRDERAQASIGGKGVQGLLKGGKRRTISRPSLRRVPRREARTRCRGRSTRTWTWLRQSKTMGAAPTTLR